MYFHWIVFKNAPTVKTFLQGLDVQSCNLKDSLQAETFPNVSTAVLIDQNYVNQNVGQQR